MGICYNMLLFRLQIWSMESYVCRTAAWNSLLPAGEVLLTYLITEAFINQA